MKANTEIQKRVVELSSKLSILTDKQINWGYTNCLDSFAVMHHKKTCCLECGNSWNDDLDLWKNELLGIVCPECKTKLKLNYEKKPVYKDINYFSIITTKNNFQVIRIIQVTKFMKKNTSASNSYKEVMQHWIDSNGKIFSMSLSVMGMSQYFDNWIMSSELTLRPKSFNSSHRYSINPYKVYPIRNVLSKIKRNGFKGFFYGILPQDLFSNILKDSKCETLIKNNQIELLKHRIGYEANKTFIDNNWSSVKIAIKNNYEIKNYLNWKDYLDLLRYFNKDLNNSVYVCPVDLDKSHDKLVEKKSIILKREKFESLKEEIQINQENYFESKKDYIGLNFTKDNLTVKVLESVEEFYNEGSELKHCVFTNEYFKKNDSLILSARIENKIIETIEISLSKMEIIQSRGTNNKTTEYNSQILDLVNSNMNLIKSIYSKKIAA